MEAELDDIRSNQTVKSINQLKTTILDCAKNIKSNDVTFSISTLPTVCDKLTELMGGYIDTMQELESCQRAFTNLHEEVLQKVDQEDGDGEFLDLEHYDNRFQELLENANQTTTTNEIEAQVTLDEIIRPPAPDEEIVVEAPLRQIPKDPITKTAIKVAVRSTVCNHIYDKEGIENYFRQKESAKSNPTIRCPQAGCTNRNMKRSQLVLDEETNKLIQSL